MNTHPLKVLRPALFALLLLAAATLHAGKPWRPGVDQLVSESELIVIGKVISTEASLVKDKFGQPCALVKFRVTETLHGTAPKTLLVAVPAEPFYDEKGIQRLISSAYRYDLKLVEHTYVLYLAKPAVADAAYHVPAGSGSGIVDLNLDRPGDGPAELERLRAHLRKNQRSPDANVRP